ncbi:PREDICTED: interleukin-36 receptor antagonist protein-like [Gekko japonicus]|uniref:Interleukin-1 n=1 Tax=Gekko japonicus TaxID=146911 RepID=A0ABM1KSC4_GEKJA|nr:PREDICTED: interleukin-36 receptor antagonist protein-like [Gekko japonicus]XP_015276611.1 PREDICTED: interleukin-36 receptor antagonist protein-like [Gekko japonicus]
MLTMPRSKAKNTAHKPQIKNHLLTMASEEILKLPAANETVVDQDMLDWFAELFDSASMKPHLKPSIASADDVPRGIEPRNYYLRDIDHKSIYLQDKNLVAAPLQGDNSAQEETLSVLPNRFLDRQKIPLILGVKGGSQGISCGKEEEPKLQLEDTNLMDVFINDKEAKRFTFFKSYNGTTHMFESAVHPGWYLSSPVEAHKPLTLTNHLGETAITDFYFHNK